MPYYPAGYQAPTPYGSSHLLTGDNGLPQLPHPVGVGEANTQSPASGQPAKRKQVKNACSKCNFGHLHPIILCVAELSSAVLAFDWMLRVFTEIPSIQSINAFCGLPNATTMKNNAVQTRTRFYPAPFKLRQLYFNHSSTPFQFSKLPKSV